MQTVSNQYFLNECLRTLINKSLYYNIIFKSQLFRISSHPNNPCYTIAGKIKLLRLHDPLSQFPGLQEALSLGFTGRTIVKKTGKVCIHVTPWIVFVDEFWRRLNHAVEGQAMQ